MQLLLTIETLPLPCCPSATISYYCNLSTYIDLNMHIVISIITLNCELFFLFVMRV